MDSDFSYDLAELYDYMMGYSVPSMLSVMNMLFQLFYKFDKYCDLKDILYDMTEWCLTQDLTFAILSQNVL